MARPKKAVPSYRRHKASGQAVVTVDGQDIYLGSYGDPESKEKYARLVAERRSGVVPQTSVTPLTIRSLVARYWRYIDAEGRYMKNGRPTSEREWIRDSLAPLLRLYGRMLAAEFGPTKLMALRTEMARGTPRADGKPSRALARTTVNQRIRRIKQLFRWGVAMELVPPLVRHGLDAVSSLRRGESSVVRESAKVRPVPTEHVDAVIAVLPPCLSAMVKVLLLTGMRPGELVRMRGCDLDRSSDVWRYRVSGHKTEHYGVERVISIGPRARSALTPYLGSDPEQFVFSPSKSEAVRLAIQRTAASARWAARGMAGSARPNQARDADRRCHPRRGYRERYDTAALRQAIQRACRRAGVPVWTPYQLRHNAGTRLRRELGADTAQVVLGHASVTTTEIYAEVDGQAAEDAMRRFG